MTNKNRNRKRMKIGVIYGGKSGEHDASLSTAKDVIGEVDFDKYEVYPFYITRSGEWRAGARLHGPVDDVRALTFEAGGIVLGENSQALAPLFGGRSGASGTGKKDAAISAVGASNVTSGVEVMLPLLLGASGEDGLIQGMLEMLNVPYVGAGVLASAIGMDKVAMKKMFAAEGLPQCVYRYFTRGQWEKDRSFYIMEVEVSIGYPCIVKGTGAVKARNREELIEAVRAAFDCGRKVVVEEYVDGREIEVSVLGYDTPRASVPGSESGIPADIPLETAQQAQEMAIRAFQAIDGSGLSRVDFFLRREDGKLLLNDIDTLPGFAPLSRNPQLWKGSGLTYSELFDELITLALERHAERSPGGK